jgi:two-component system sensor histidine kinase AlgZ
LLLLLVTGVLSEVAYQIALYTGFGWDATPAWHREMLLRNLAVSAIVNAVVLRYFYITHQWMQQNRAEAQARVEALQARIRPHFLFNSMNTIAALTRSDPAVAERTVEDLADLFRQSLADVRQRVTFAEELELSRRYVNIEQLRMGERLRVEWDTANAPADALLPPLTLQPLLENAIYHGIEPSVQGGTIRLHAALRDDTIHVNIDNPVPDQGVESREGNRMALENIRLRFEALFGPQSRLRTRQTDGQFQVELVFPYQKQAQ